MANIRIDADGLQNNISSMRAYINSKHMTNIICRFLQITIKPLNLVNQFLGFIINSLGCLTF